MPSNEAIEVISAQIISMLQDIHRKQHNDHHFQTSRTFSGDRGRSGGNSVREVGGCKALQISDKFVLNFHSF